jgi:hypothetical protein
MLELWIHGYHAARISFELDAELSHGWIRVSNLVGCYDTFPLKFAYQTPVFPQDADCLLSQIDKLLATDTSVLWTSMFSDVILRLTPSNPIFDSCEVSVRIRGLGQIGYSGTESCDLNISSANVSRDSIVATRETLLKFLQSQ